MLSSFTGFFIGFNSKKNYHDLAILAGMCIVYTNAQWFIESLHVQKEASIKSDYIQTVSHKLITFHSADYESQLKTI